MLKGLAKKYAERVFRDFVRCGGVAAKKEHAEARIEICRACPMFGIVEPKEGVKMEGCTVCGCPAATKPWYLSYFRIRGKERKSLTVEELAQIKLGNRENVIEVKSECPHEEGNKWADLDKKFIK